MRTFEVEVQVPNTQGELKTGGVCEDGHLDDNSIPRRPPCLSNRCITFAGITKIFLAGTRPCPGGPGYPGRPGTTLAQVARPVLPGSAHRHQWPDSPGGRYAGRGPQSSTERATPRSTNDAAIFLYLTHRQGLRRRPRSLRREPSPTSASAGRSSPGCWRPSRSCWGWCRTSSWASTCFPRSISRSSRSPPTCRAPAPRRWKPASPEPIEEAINTVSGVDELRSTVARRDHGHRDRPVRAGKGRRRGRPGGSRQDRRHHEAASRRAWTRRWSTSSTSTPARS